MFYILSILISEPQRYLMFSLYATALKIEACFPSKNRVVFVGFVCLLLQINENNLFSKINIINIF
jgi:hypothetical protein